MRTMSPLVPLAFAMLLPDAAMAALVGFDGARQYTVEIQPYLVVAGNPADALYATARGAGFDGVAALQLRTAGAYSLCSGAVLAGGRDVLTAAHCVTDGEGNLELISGTAVLFPSGGGTDQIAIEGATFHPLWTGSYLAGFDLALLRLSRPVSAGVQTYELYDDGLDASSAYTVAGFGRSGTGATGSTLASGTRRKGSNEFEMTLEMMGFGSDDVLISDFDGPAGTGDGFGYFFNLAGPGLGMDEVAVAPGDSGGPAFIGGRIAGITSFGLRLATTTGATSDVDGVLNSSFGEFSGFTRVSSYDDWIVGPHSFAFVPEGSTWLYAAGGLVLILLGRRRVI